MLPRDHRLGTAADFAAVVRTGRRAGTSRLVVHALMSGRSVPRAGFVVSKKVGNSVVRHRVTRRLRPLVRDQLRGLPLGTAIVVRALPSAATATSAELGVDLRAGLASAVRKARSQPKVEAGPRAIAVDGSTSASAEPVAAADGGAA